MSDQVPVLAITSDDRRLHVGLPHVLVGHLGDEDLTAESWEFYDDQGFRLEPTADGLERVTGQPFPGPLDRTLLVDRIDLFHAMIQRRLTTDVKETVQASQTPQRERVPRVSGDLTDVLLALDALAGARPASPADPDTGSWLHNLWHRLGG